MMIASTMPVKTFPARRTSFKVAGSPLNSAITATPANESTRKHLSNLDKLLQKQQQQHNNTSQTNHDQPKGKGILGSLNLARLWPQLKAAEEMSPRHLNRLQRLLSKSMEYSPRSSLGARWREYHGCEDWSGLLDPLDENLRREIVRYGEFIQAAYRVFHTDPSTSPDKAPSPRHVIPPDRSYRVTKGLYATSSVGLPKWVDDKAPDLGWLTQRTSWVGYVAVCDDPREIARMGRRDIVIALRGTATCLEWAENFRDVLVQMPDESESETETETNSGLQAKVECGFLSLYKTSGTHVPSLSDSVVQEIRRLINQYKGETLSITVTGHSLGAALALLVADDISVCMPEVPPVAVFSFGGPRVGNRGFASRIESKGVKVLRIVNSQDVITRVPGLFASEGLDKKIRHTNAAGILDVLDENMPWAYSHVGTELRLETKMSPYLKPNADVACCHDLESYLHLVDGFLSSKCPFRSNAKRSLWKLVNEQRSNVKKLYTSKVKTLSVKFDRHGMGGLNSPSCLPSPSQQ